MSIARTALTGGPGTLGFAGSSFHAKEDTAIDYFHDTEEIVSQVLGVVDEVSINRGVRMSWTPFGLYDLTLLAVLYPHIAVQVGASVFGSADVPAVFAGVNGDAVTITAAAVTKMPSLYLGPTKDLYGAMEILGVVGSGLDPEGANSFYTLLTAQSYTPVAIDKTKYKRQRYSAAWGSVSGFTAFQAQDYWEITPAVKYQKMPVQGLDVDYWVKTVQFMAKCKPIGMTMVQGSNALQFQGSGNPNGELLGKTIGDLVITGSGVSVTLKNAALKSAGFEFGGVKLRQGEYGWVSTQPGSSGANTPAIVFA
jgi:hypothetical protein